MYSSPSDVRGIVKPRHVESSKRDLGSLLIVGGSDVYSGAPALAGLAALRTGCGLAVVAAPVSIASTVRSYSPNLIVHSLSSNVVTLRDVDKISELLASSDAMILGPGIGRSAQTAEAVPSIIQASTNVRKPVLIDADALRALAKNKDVIRNANAVITPHAGEFKAISGAEVPRQRKQRLDACIKFALEHSCVILLKGHHTIVSDGHRFKVNRTGNPCLSVGGTGDVLSGIIGAYLAQHVDRFRAAVAGAYVHGLAGDLVRKRTGFHMLASDLVDALPGVLRKYDRMQCN